MGGNIKRKLGNGSFAEVLPSPSNPDNECLKLFYKDSEGSSIFRELDVLQSVRNCQNCCQLLRVVDMEKEMFGLYTEMQKKRRKNFEQFALLFKRDYKCYDRFCLRKYTKKQQVLSVIYDVIEAVSELHEQGILHNDLKTDNILVNKEDKEGIIIDFGYSCPKGMFEIKPQWNIMDQAIVPPEYSGIVSRMVPNEKLDIWCLGNLLYFYLSPGSFVNSFYFENHPLPRTKVLHSLRVNIFVRLADDFVVSFATK
ncbi:hypothetical protein GpartN1_g5623.t1 [Galdieria partita]|uniref:Protein kinase domain-containing protein n=1 Tax=Galdieria partita TaxID=83374 RepID=A0A9C7Q1J0_9RHOD|nr:hypothetical protein GpartN1_g5623.t1 [Galdieria partita]